jgi:HEAT repeat protein
VAESAEHRWTVSDLTRALLHGTRLPGEPDGPPPFPQYMLHGYRRESAARDLGKRAVDAPECLAPLVFVATHDDDEDLRLVCLQQLFEVGWPGLEAFMLAMTFDPSAKVRRLALEALGLREFPSTSSAANRMLADSDAEISEKARAMLAGEKWDVWQL